MFVIVGLGNPGKKYMHTRHNAGFLAVKLLAKKHNIDLKKSAHKAIVGEGRIEGERVALVLPQTFMNLSGQSVVEVINWYKIHPEDELIVLYDDIDLPAGQLRIRAKGSAGTHNGMKSILYLTGTDEFPRVRIGVGRPQPGRDLADFVISDFPQDERPLMMEAFENAGIAVEEIIKDGVSQAQANFNVKRNKKNQ